MAIVADTDVVSFVFKENPNAWLYTPHLLNVPKFISFMTLAELRRWQLQHHWGAAKRRKLQRFMEGFGVIYADEDLCDMWAQVMSQARHKGRPIATADAWVAATALLFNVPLVTHNRLDFANVDGLTVISEAN